MQQPFYIGTKVICWSFLLLATACIDSYVPDVVDSVHSYLVVDGFINSSGTTTINLSRSQRIAETGKPQPEAKALLYIQEEQGGQFALHESKTGIYNSANLNLDPQKKYRLYIKTAWNKEYASNFMPVIFTPDFEISPNIESTGLQIAINSEGGPEQPTYYRWDYDETWEFTSIGQSVLDYKNNRLVPRNENIYRCWRSEKPSKINLTSTEKLSVNKLVNHPLVFHPKNSEKLRYKYSIQVRQFAQTKEEYQYWEALRTNTEKIGTLFDPQPTQVSGNIECLSDPNEPVLGYVGITTMVEKRIFIDKLNLPASWISKTGYEDCRIGLLSEDFPPPPRGSQNPWNYVANGALIIIAPVDSANITIDYLYSTANCTDCTLKGSNVRPDFWR
ncbi:DUF4249 domain-containing protein [Adhaeribacter aquaticus]|uniref:DUF4249 domain-containing protein n=1 Tax=Adhaeribacter aquaticus TaxID=299567 RepID=UPI000427A8D4|nr:DUF4249 domain-containing protein [Adhaeribacter aquaticus]